MKTESRGGAFFFNRTWAITMTLLMLTLGSANGKESEAIPVNNNRQLFIDEHLIDEKRGVELILHQPIPREILVESDQPWEGPNQAYPTVFKDGDRYKLYYRSSPGEAFAHAVPKPLPNGPPGWNWTYTALAESEDGIHWTKPNLGVVEFNGSKENNLVWPTEANTPWRDKNYPGTDIFPFKDENPKASAAERYKALANVGEYELAALVSPDGIHWKPLRTKPVISYPDPDPMMDPPSLGFWDPNRKQYVAYLRCWINYRIRGFRRVTSDDFIHWSKAEVIDFGDYEIEHLYTNATTLYDRAPGLYFMFAKRFVPGRKFDQTRRAPGLSEIVLLTSRDGIRFDRPFMEPFLPPGLDRDNWHDRAIMMARGVLQLTPTELSLYYLEHYHLDTVRIRRASLRVDGFASLHASWEGGEFTTKPLKFKGNELELNYSTSVAGSIRVELQDESGKPIPGYRLEECDEIFGDELDRLVTWNKGHSDVLTSDREEIPYKRSDFGRALAGKTIRLRFVMKATHLYAFRFQ